LKYSFFILQKLLSYLKPSPDFFGSRRFKEIKESRQRKQRNLFN